MVALATGSVLGGVRRTTEPAPSRRSSAKNARSFPEESPTFWLARPSFHGTSDNTLIFGLWYRRKQAGFSAGTGARLRCRAWRRSWRSRRSVSKCSMPARLRFSRGSPGESSPPSSRQQGHQVTDNTGGQRGGGNHEGVLENEHELTANERSNRLLEDQPPLVSDVRCNAPVVGHHIALVRAEGRALDAKGLHRGWALRVRSIGP